MMIILVILALVIVLLMLIGSYRPINYRTTPRGERASKRDTATGDGLIYGETPDGSWQGGKLPDDFTPGGGDFGGAGSSGSWDSDAGDGGDGGSD